MEKCRTEYYSVIKFRICCQKNGNTNCKLPKLLVLHTHKPKTCFVYNLRDILCKVIKCFMSVSHVMYCSKQTEMYFS